MMRYNTQLSILKMALPPIFLAILWMVVNQSLLWFGYHYCFWPWDWGSYWCRAARLEITVAEVRQAVSIMLALLAPQR
jgi:hypothetical protein